MKLLKIAPLILITILNAGCIPKRDIYIKVGYPTEQRSYKTERDFRKLLSAEDFLESKFLFDLEEDNPGIKYSKLTLPKTRNNESIEYVKIVTMNSESYLDDVKLSYNLDGLNNLVLSFSSPYSEYKSMIHNAIKISDNFGISIDEDIMKHLDLEKNLTDNPTLKRKYKEILTDNNKYLIELRKESNKYKYSLHFNYIDPKPKNKLNHEIHQLDQVGMTDFSTEQIQKLEKTDERKEYNSLRKYPFSTSPEELSFKIHKIGNMKRSISLKATIPTHTLYDDEFMSDLFLLKDCVDPNIIEDKDDLIKKLKVAKSTNQSFNIRVNDTLLNYSYDSIVDCFFVSISITKDVKEEIENNELERIFKEN